MELIIPALCHILFFHSTLQCYQARLEFSDQGFGGIDSAYRELNDEIDVINTDILRSSSDNERKDTKIGGSDKEVNNMGDNKRETSEIYDESGEKRRGGHLRRANAEKRRKSNRERIRNRHLNRLHHQRKGSFALETPSETDQSDHNVDIAHYYLTKPSDIANMSAMLGPGPVPIYYPYQTTGTSTALPHFTKNTSSIGKNSSKLSSPNISLESYELVSVVGEHKKGHRGKFKSHNEVGGNSEAIVLDQAMKESLRPYKQHLIYNSKKDERSNENPKTVHKKRKYKQMNNEAVNTKKDVEKFHLNEEEQFTNLSVINKSFKNAASKKYMLKNSLFDPPEIESKLERQEARIIVDKISDEDANKLSLLNAEHEINEEEHTSLRDETPELETINENIKPRTSSQKGIRHKIEHGDWLDQVTLFPLPDYSVRKNRTHNKKLSLAEAQKKILRGSSANDEKTATNNRKHKRNKSAVMKYLPSFDETSEENDVRADYVLDNNDGEAKNKRDERDIKSRVERNDFKIPRLRSIFNHHSTSDENGDETYDTDVKQDEQLSSSYKNKNENTNNKQESLEGEEEDYEYDSQLSGNGKPNSKISIENRTVSTTHSTCSSISNVVQSINPTKKPNKPKSTLTTHCKPEHKSTGIGQNNETIDPYQQFLCGQLADDFVNEVLKKVKQSRKISRELGYSNETEETCDRCIELKPIKVPEAAVMKSSLGKCLKNYKPVQNCSVCCSVPKPMVKYLNTLVYFEKENENNFYNKIQDDSTFIFTGDYPETPIKSENGMKINENYDDERSPFNKDTFDRQHFREDANEEKNEDKTADSDSFEKSKGKFSARLRTSGEDTVSESKDVERVKETEGEVKRNLAKFSSSKINRDNEGKQPDFKENMKEKFDAIFNFHDSAPLVKDYNSKEATYPHHTRSFGKTRKNYLNDRNQIGENTLNKPHNFKKTPIRNSDRYHDKSNYNYFKQYPYKNLPVNPHPNYALNHGGSVLGDSLSKDQNSDDVYEIQHSNRMLSNANDKVNFKDKYFGYPPRKYPGDNKLSQNENYKGYGQKYDFLYEDNGEYSLYPNLEGKGLEEEVGKTFENYKSNGGDNPRMVKRDADPVPVYDEESNVFFEIPDIEYDLYK